MPRWWRHFWFESATAETLGIARLLFFSLLLAFYLPVDATGWGDVSTAFWMPTFFFERLRAGPPSTAALTVAQFLWRAVLVTGALGLYTRASTIAAFALGAFLLGIPHSFGHTFHFDALLVFTLLILACSRAGDAWSIDALRLATRGRSLPAPSGEYTWPGRLVQVMMSLVFFAAGVAKLRHGGLAWVTSSHMSLVLMSAVYHVSDADPISRAGLWIARHAWAAHAIAFLSLTIEVGYVTSLVSTRARRLFVPAAVGMLIGIRVLMGPTFGGFLIANVFWVPWNRVMASVRSRAKRRATALTVFYDGACPHCAEVAAVLARLDVFGLALLVDAAASEDAAAVHPDIDPGACLDSIHAVHEDGRVTAGIDAYRDIAARLPLLWPFAPLLTIRPVASAAARVYASMARRRHRPGVITVRGDACQG